jgi:hypothetical protein
MEKSESEKLLDASIEKLRAEIEVNEKNVEHLKFDLGVKKARLKKLEAAIQPKEE